MTVSDCLGAALLVLLCALTVGVFVHIFISVGQLRRAPAQKPQPPRSKTPQTTTLFEVSSPLKQKPTRAPEPVMSVLDELTRRETQVAQLAARGLTDAEIASRLAISERTVGNHLYSIYRKLDINSRRELKYILQSVEQDP